MNSMCEYNRKRTHWLIQIPDDLHHYYGAFWSEAAELVSSQSMPFPIPERNSFTGKLVIRTTMTKNSSLPMLLACICKTTG